MTVVQRVIITQDPGSQSTGQTPSTFLQANHQIKQLCSELPPSIVMKEPLFFVIGGAVLGFLLITLLSLIWYLKRRVSQSDGHINTRARRHSVSNTTSAVCQHAFYDVFLSFYFHSVSCQSVGKKLAVVEVCVGRQVDRVRGRERRQAGEQEQVINNRLEEAEDRDIQPYSAKAEQYGECSAG